MERGERNLMVRVLVFHARISLQIAPALSRRLFDCCCPLAVIHSAGALKSAKFLRGSAYRFWRTQNPATEHVTNNG